MFEIIKSPGYCFDEYGEIYIKIYDATGEFNKTGTTGFVSLLNGRAFSKPDQNRFMVKKYEQVEELKIIEC